MCASRGVVRPSTSGKVSPAPTTLIAAVPKMSGTGFSYSRPSTATMKGSISVMSTRSTISQFGLKMAFQLPDVKKFENAPEIAHLKLQRSGVKSIDKDEVHAEEGELQGCWPKSLRLIKSCLGSCFQFFRNLITGAPYEELDDLNPIKPRTRHSIDFILRLSTDNPVQKSVGGPSRQTMHQTPTNTRTNTQSRGQVVKQDPTQVLKRRAYRSIYEGLAHLHEVNHLYKQLTLILTFSRYAKEPLTPQELELTHKRTVLGSYVWLATYILEQVQYDNDVVYFGYSAHDLEDVFRAMEKLVSESVHCWKAMVSTVEQVEEVHEKMQKVFSSVLSKISKDNAGIDFKEMRHIRAHSNYQRRKEELEKLKEFEGARSHQKNYTSFSLAPLRILYKDAKTHNPSWKGFDVLPQGKKFAMLKLLLNDALKIFQVLQEQLDHVGRLLQIPQAPFPHAHPPKFTNPTVVLSFDDGLVHMQKFLDEILALNKVWTPQEIKDFLEVEKITTDNLDLLTVGTATVRTLLHDARHLIHVCYELTRELDYAESRQMPVYEDVVAHAVHNYNLEEAEKKDSTEKQKKMSMMSHESNWRPIYPRHFHKQSTFDIEERNLGQRDVEHKFDRSVYQDIIKELPVLTNNLTLSFTLQEAENVFSESSHQLLSTIVHM